MKNFILRNFIFTGIVLISILVLIKYFNPENAFIESHDNLDSLFVYWSLLSNYKLEYFQLLEYFKEFGKGIPLSFVYHGINIGELIYFLPNPIYAYILNELIQKIIAFIGMFLLLSKISDKNVIVINKSIIPFFVALIFALLPFNPSPFISIAGLPLLLFSIYAILFEDKKFYWTYIFIYPLYSSLVLFGFVILASLGLFLIYIIIFKKKLFDLVKYSKIILLLISGYSISSYKLIYSYFFLDFETIRNNCVGTCLSNLSFLDFKINNFLNSFFQIIIFGQEHAVSLHTYMPIITLLLVTYLIKKYSSFYLRNLELLAYLKFLILTVLITSLLYAFFRDLLIYIPLKIDVFKSFNFSRVHWLHPVLWYLIFYLNLLLIFDFYKNRLLAISFLKKLIFFLFISLILVYFINIERIEIYSVRYYEFIKILNFIFFLILTFLGTTFCLLFFNKISFFLKNIIYKFNISLGKFLVAFILIAQAIIVLNPYKVNKMFVINKFDYSIHHAGLKNTTFKKYFQKDIFNQIKNFIGVDYGNKVFGVVGFSPSVLIFNGLKTINFYLPLYPIDNLRLVYSIIKDELKRSKKYENFAFYKGKKRNYLYASEIKTQYFYEENSKMLHISPKFDHNAMKKAKLDFIISAVKIQNFYDIGLNQKKIFESGKNKIYLYKIKK